MDIICDPLKHEADQENTNTREAPSFRSSKYHLGTSSSGIDLDLVRKSVCIAKGSHIHIKV